MKRHAIVAAAAAILWWGIVVWLDTHPTLQMARHDFGGVRLAAPVAWGKPEVDGSGIFIHSAMDKNSRHDSLRWSLTLIDKGTKVEPDAVVRELRKGYDEAEGLRSIRLENGIVAQTWVDWEPLGEFNRKVRAYVFMGENGRVYCALQPLGRDWRVNRRYTHIFRKVLGSLEFSGSKDIDKNRFEG